MQNNKHSKRRIWLSLVSLLICITALNVEVLTINNFPISETIISPGKFIGVVAKNGLLEFYQNATHCNKLYATWADNSSSPAPFFNPIPMFRAAKYNPKNGNVEFGPQIDIPFPRYSSFTYVAEYTMSVNPKNPKNITIGADLVDPALSSSNPPALRQSIVATTCNGGKTWSSKPWDVNIFPDIFKHGDSRVIFDTFGNNWLVTLSAPVSNLTGPLNLSIAVSTDGGKTYIPVTTLPAPAGFDFGIDYPQLVAGSDGQNGFGVYITVDLIDNASNTIAPSIIFIPVTGLGGYGAPVLYKLKALTNLTQNGSPAISKNGDLYISYLNIPPTATSTFTNLLVVIPGGIVGVSNGNIQGPFVVAATNMQATSPVTGLTSIEFQPQRGVGSNTFSAAVFDDSRNRIYIFYADIIPAGSQDMSLFLKWSDDMGVTFNGPIMINDVTENNRCLQSIARDPKKGNLFFTWYDCRDDNTNQTGRYFGAVISAKELEELMTVAKSVKSAIYSERTDAHYNIAGRVKKKFQQLEQLKGDTKR